MPQLLYGTGRTTITPPLGLELCGYGPYLERRSTKIHQDLQCTALALSDGEQTYVWVSNDLIWTDRSLIESTHRLVHGAYGLDPAHVVITNTHTHSGPATMKTVAWGAWNEDYADTLPGKFAEAIGQAVSNMESGRIGFGRVAIPKLSVNRVDEGGIVDQDALLMRIDDNEGHLRVVTINFSAHPVTLGASTLVCGDYPADGISKMERELDGVRMLFFQGSCGNLNCRGFGDGLDAMDANGTLLKNSVLPALDEIETTSDVTLYGDTVEMPLPTKVPEREPLEAELAGYEKQGTTFEGDITSRDYRQLRFEQDWRKKQLELIDTPHPQRIEIKVAYLRVNDGVLLSHPMELFLEYGTGIKEASPYPHTMVIGYANEPVGYLARPQDFSQKGFGWYAAVFAPRICRHLEFEPEAGEVFRDHLIALLHWIKEREGACNLPSSD
ncbi:MAG: neutral/alkaline non-lysosomal ceramidase N-terminal domain-containing protein [Candidatus Latescibacteria bacterium]|jgi:hypothetical protein|nr:neutral/alkaline non-lysosomal ceramidase N-terminal domain-containing protein [Candidatus Latescibacterota bacterium]MDP7238349.1 neutral/alkaline non-lysosomal ceramidase N-terminal domain-containing protein [Candidatus Latescibacterota bacterium]